MIGNLVLDSPLRSPVCGKICPRIKQRFPDTLGLPLIIYGQKGKDCWEELSLPDKYRKSDAQQNCSLSRLMMVLVTLGGSVGGRISFICALTVFFISLQMAVSVRGLYFVVTLFLASFFGSIFMLGPVLPLLLLSPAWYRWITDRIVATWLTLPVV